MQKEIIRNSTLAINQIIFYPINPEIRYEINIHLKNFV